MYFISRNISRVNARWRRVIWARGQFWQESKMGEISHKYFQPRELSTHLSSKGVHCPLILCHWGSLWDLKVEPDHCMEKNHWQDRRTRQDASSIQVFVKSQWKWKWMEDLLQPFCQLEVMNKTECTENFHSWLSGLHPAWNSHLHVLQPLYNGKECISVKTVLQKLPTQFLTTAEVTKYAFQNPFTCLQMRQLNKYYT